MRAVLVALTQLAGFALAVYGVALVYRPLAFILGGVVLVAMAFAVETAS